MKVLSADCCSGKKYIFELEIMKHLRDTDPTHSGRQHISLLLDSLEHFGPYGRHVCLVLEPMTGDLSSFGTIFDACQVPSSLMRRFTRQLLLALDYAHQSSVIHTGGATKKTLLMRKQ